MGWLRLLLLRVARCFSYGNQYFNVPSCGRLSGRSGPAPGGWRCRLGSAFGLATLLLGVCAPALAQTTAPRFDTPVACGVGPEGRCYIQQFVDHDPGPGARDLACGGLSYDGHKGTDIAVRSLAEMRSGVAVLAAAAGTVIGQRDGMADIDVRELGGREALAGKDAGNGVVIDHGDGWQTQYSHMRRGSVTVRKGQRVEAGERLGLIGMSGAAAFPHLDFAVRHDDVVVDPFLGLGGRPDCTDGSRSNAATEPRADSLWTPAAADTLQYRPSGIVIAGFAGEAADRDKALSGAYAEPPDSGAAALVLFVEVFGVQAGDRQEIEIVAPTGEIWVENAEDLSRDQARRYKFAGRKRPDAGWPTGHFVGRYRLIRAGQVVVSTERVWSAR